jgi:biotin synthase
MVAAQLRGMPGMTEMTKTSEMSDTVRDLIRHDWSLAEVHALFALPFMDLILRAQRVHRAHHAPNAEPLMAVAAVREHARRAREAGATRFCLGAAYRAPKARDLGVISEMIREIHALGLESCATLGMLQPAQAQQLKAAGLDYYNHNLDTSAEYYSEIITTRTYQDRLDTLAAVRAAGLKVCCGGIVGMGESPTDRAQLLRTLANLPEHPESVPINQLVRVSGTPLAQAADVDPFDFVRTIAVARVLMPRAHVRLSAGREGMSDELQALCFLAGANSIFCGEKLLTTGNPELARDRQLFARLGLTAEGHEAGSRGA